MFFSFCLPGASRFDRRAGPTCKYKVIVLHKTNAKVIILLFSQGAPGPKGEPGEGLNEVRDIFLSLPSGFSCYSKSNLMV